MKNEDSCALNQSPCVTRQVSIYEDGLL